MPSKSPFEQFAECCEAVGLKARACRSDHWQITGGLLLVNVWPWSKKGVRMHVAGSAGAVTIDHPVEAIKAAKEGPGRGTKKVARKNTRSFKTRVRRALLAKRDRCFYCGRRVAFHDSRLDHFIPILNGGSNSQDNYRLACESCDSRKGSMMPGEFIAIMCRHQEERMQLAEV